MRPCGFNHLLQVGVLSCAVVLGLPGVGPRRGNDVVYAQHNGQGKPPTLQTDPSPLEQPAAAAADPIHAKMDHERMKAVEDDRHKKLAEDVDRLVSLTNELKTDVDKTTKDELSLDVIKKAQEIEKLAHDVQSRMKS